MYDVASTVEISRWSGVVTLISTITVRNAGGAARELSEIRLGIPQGYVGRVIFAKVEVEGVEAAVTREDNWYVAKLQKPVTLRPEGTVEARATFVMTEMVKEVNETRTVVDVVLRPLVEGVVRNFTLEITHPSGVEPAEIPEGFTKAPKILRYTASNITEEETVMELTFNALTRNENLYLLFADVSRRVELEPGGTVRVIDTIVVKNAGPTRFPSTESLEYHLPEGASEVRVESVLGRDLKQGLEGGVLSFTLPFDLGPGERATVIVKYSVRAPLELNAPWILSTSFDSNASSPLDLLILGFSVTVVAPHALEATTPSATYVNVTRFHAMPLSAAAKFPLLAAIIPVPGFASYFAIGLAAALAFSELRPILLRKPLSPELAEWIGKALEEVEALSEILALRRKYRRGEVEYKFYLKETKRLTNKAKAARESAAKLERASSVATWRGLPRVRRLRKELSSVDKEWHAVGRLLAQRKITREEAGKRWEELEDREESLIVELRDILRSALA